jgi:FixJ family two-component response regulator
MIFIVDDDKYVRRGFEILFKSAGVECLSFESAEDFLDKVNIKDNDLLILDMHMPGMNGCELLEHLSGRNTFLPVIIATAYDEPASRECSKKYGAIAYLRKPVDGEALLDLVKYSTHPV